MSDRHLPSLKEASGVVLARVGGLTDALSGLPATRVANHTIRPFRDGPGVGLLCYRCQSYGGWGHETFTGPLDRMIALVAKHVGYAGETKHAAALAGLAGDPVVGLKLLAEQITRDGA